MKFLVLGSGLMGPAAAYIEMKADDVSAVTLADRSPEQLAVAQKRLAGRPGPSPFLPVTMWCWPRCLRRLSRWGCTRPTLPRGCGVEPGLTEI